MPASVNYFIFIAGLIFSRPFVTSSFFVAKPLPPAVGAFGGSGSGGTSSYRTRENGTPLDTMPTSADHGMEKVDWGSEETEGTEGGKGAADGGESVEAVMVAGSEERRDLEREEEALIRELERMDNSIENGDNPPVAGVGEGEGSSTSGSSSISSICSSSSSSSSSLPSSPPAPAAPAPLEEQALIDDQAVEHQLDDIFDSIILDDVDVDVVDDDFDVVVDGEDSRGVPAADDERHTPAAHDRPAMPAGGWGSPDAGKADAVREQPAEPRQEPEISDLATAPPGGETGFSRPAGDLQARAGSPPGVTSAAALQGHAATASPEGGGGAPTRGDSSSSSSSSSPPPSATAGSGPLWGNPRRWESLPPQPAADVTDSEEGEEEESQDLEGFGDAGDEDDDEDEADVRVLLDPIELPPSAATDEIWNDQHLQEQLDAYWEQSRRGGAGAIDRCAAAVGLRGRRASPPAHVRPR